MGADKTYSTRRIRRIRIHVKKKKSVLQEMRLLFLRAYTVFEGKDASNSKNEYNLFYGK